MPTPKRTIRATPGHCLVATPVFDTYWSFAANRQAAFYRRLSNAQPPWTDDAILSKYRFTNAYRASDRVSQYLIRHVIYSGAPSPQETFFRILLFKLFNRVETWESLSAAVGFPSWQTFDIATYSRTLDDRLSRGHRVYSAAYIMPNPAFGHARKHRNHLALLEHMMRTDAASKIADAPSMKAVFTLLRSYPSLGDFLAFQITIDLNYSTLINFSEMDFVVAGPGARSGIRKCFVDTSALSAEDIIRVVTERASDEFSSRGLAFQTLWGRPLQLIDCQNIFCEVDKYSRAVHPHYVGTPGRTRIKQTYTPNYAPLPQWYPPKWNLVPGSLAGRSLARECPAPSQRAGPQPSMTRPPALPRGTARP
jgi:alpha-glutamyl/putrescinyl thymine pyrophosphorylase clade 1